MGNLSKRFGVHGVKPVRGSLVLVCLVLALLLLSSGVAYADVADGDSSSGDVPVVSVVPQVRVAVENGPVLSDAFLFTLSDHAGEELQTRFNDSEGYVSFSRLSFTTDDLNTDSETGQPIATIFTYDVSQLIDDESTYVYDMGTIRMSVTVAPGEDGALQTDVAYVRLAGEGDPEPTDDPTFVNRYVTVIIHEVKRSREEPYDPLPGAHYGLWMVNPDGEDFYMGLGRNQMEIDGSELESSENGDLYYDIPVLDGAFYYSLEEWPPPAGHLVDPYPSEYFKIEYNKDTGEFRRVYESDPDFGDYSSVGRTPSNTGTSEDPDDGSSVSDSPADDGSENASPAGSNPEGGDNTDKTQKSKATATSNTSSQKLPATSDTTPGSPAALFATGALALLAGYLCRMRRCVTRPRPSSR